MIDVSRIAAVSIALVGAVPQASSGFQSEPLVAEVVFKAKAEAVHSGDVVVLRRDGEEVRVRLVKVDAPEVSQPFGNEAKEYLAGLVVGREVTVRALDYGTSDGVGLARVLVGKSDVGLEMVSAGLAWYCRGRSEDTELAVAEGQAREQRKGLWSQKHPESPWEHRGARSCMNGARF